MTTRIRRTFHRPVAVLPVIHVASTEQAIREALIAFDEGADGAFLIDHDGGPPHALVTIVEEVRDRLLNVGHERPWLGVNLLGLTPAESFAALHELHAWDVRGVWCDGAATAAEGVVKHATSDGVWASLYFAGVAFKGQPPSGMEIGDEAALAAAFGADVLTTSGPHTGVPCDPAKVRALRAAADPRLSVAVASGVSVGNAAALVEAGADALLVATGVSRDFHSLDSAKLRALVQAVRALH